MTGPEGVRVTPAELADAARALRAAADTVHDTLLDTDEPSMRNPEPYAEVMFGPADEVAAHYVRLTHQFAEHVTAYADRLRGAADVFATAAAEFERIDWTHGKGMGNR